MSYKKVAINAAKVAKDYQISPVKTWKFFAENEYEYSPTSQEKPCPKNTFLGLCQEGKLKGIPAEDYTASKNNRHYGLTAITILKNSSGKIYTASELWKEVMMHETDHNKRANSQMEVVLGLWEEGLIIP